jgi:hypothetical protein
MISRFSRLCGIAITRLLTRVEMNFKCASLASDGFARGEQINPWHDLECRFSIRGGEKVSLLHKLDIMEYNIVTLF